MRILGIDPGLQTTGFGVVDVDGARAALRGQRHHQHHAPGARRTAGAAEGAVRRHRRGGRALPARRGGGRDRVRQRQSAVDAAAGPGARRLPDGAGGEQPGGGRVHRAADEAGRGRPRQGGQGAGAGDGQAPAAAARACPARTRPMRWASRSRMRRSGAPWRGSAMPPRWRACRAGCTGRGARAEVPLQGPIATAGVSRSWRLSCRASAPAHSRQRARGRPAGSPKSRPDPLRSSPRPAEPRPATRP